MRLWHGHVIRMDYLDRLNPDQRAAVEHGADGDARPLLIIAGAGSGKTDTLAHRVAHLVMSGADPHRILLLTFSRRAAAEMERRAERILNRASGTNASAGLIWSGTFHAIGARFLREYAERIGLDRAFTIHDREDSADLMNLVRHELGFSRTESRFPQKGTCLSIYSRAVNAEAPLDEVLGKAFPWCANWAAELKKLFAAYVEAKQRQNVLDYDDLLALLGAHAGRARLRGRDRRALRSHPDRRISGHQPAAGLDPARAQAEREGDDRGRRRCAVDLFVPRRDRAQHPRLPRPLHAGKRAS